MILKAFSLLDLKTGHFNVPFFMPHTQLAIRAVVDLAADANTTVGRHPSDFALCEVGTFDDQTGSFSVLMPTQLGVVTSFLSPTSDQSSLPLFAAGNGSTMFHPPASTEE